MSSGGQKCGLSSFLSMSCRGRVEDFAKRLSSRLRTLGSHDDNGSADESSWLAASEDQVSLAQPRQTLNLDLELVSPGSPVPEPEEDETQALINMDTLSDSILNLRHSHSDDCQCPESKEHQKNLFKISISNDSDSDCSFYDTENDVEQRLGGYLNGDTNSESSRSQETISTTQDEPFATTSDCTPQPSSSSGNTSTLSLRDEDCPSLEVNGSTEVCRCDEGVDNCHKSNGSVTSGFNAEETRNSDEETYVSHLIVDRDMTVEYGKALLTTAEVAINGSLSSMEIAGCGAKEVSDDEAEDEKEDTRAPRVRRCSSLKTGKTPPSTPGGKKIVRFADVLGLDLAAVRTFMDDIPRVPVSAFVDLPGADLDHSSRPSPTNFHGNRVGKFLMPLFQQPGGLPKFLDLVKERQVCLENAFVNDPVSLSISGIVRVRNLDFNKSLYVRYSLDSWKTFSDVQATYVDNSCDGFSDKFSFLLYAHTLSVGDRIEFACRYHCKGCQYWDNNNGANYSFQCLPTTNRSTDRYAPVEDWGASFY